MPLCQIEVIALSPPPPNLRTSESPTQDGLGSQPFPCTQGGRAYTATPPIPVVCGKLDLAVKGTPLKRWVSHGGTQGTGTYTGLTVASRQMESSSVTSIVDKVTLKNHQLGTSLAVQSLDSTLPLQGP